MQTTTTVVIGAGQAGLAMSRCLTERSIDHVVLERGEVATSWSRRWDSLRLLTPNWQSRLPGFRYDGDDPDGYMSMPQVVGYLHRYAAAIDAPVETSTEVVALDPDGEGYLVTTTQGQWHTRTVVIASGAYNQPDLPTVAAALPATVASITPADYHGPDHLDDGGVLVVGAGATGIQLAEEIQRSGRPVTLSVGGHVRVPRIYRGMDIMWWLDAAGILDERYDEVDDIVRVRRLPSFQLVGSDERRTLDLNALQDLGVKLVGKLAGITTEGTAQFSGSLRNQCTLADLKLGRLLDTIDAWATEKGVDDEYEPPQRFQPTRVEASPPLLMNLTSGQFKTVLWATGFHSEHPWLHLPIIGAKGQICHDGGVTPAAGVYVLGCNFLRRRKSTFIDGVGDDARELCDHMAGYLNELART
ncbi:MAG TPA: NAD(P)-binding domain-containing protein [Acidimicrobiales bacterium]|jgi:putative flavoprotein involved in K+ transport|nr:NAD(P)-binding domain-containing protein [Acidimicrobiales bacterium]